MKNQFIEETRLSALIKSGNQLAFAAVYNRYHKQLYVLAYRYLKSREMAEDAVQQIFVELWENRERIDPSGNVRGFLFVSLRNRTLNILRDQKRMLEKNYRMLIESEVSEEDEGAVEGIAEKMIRIQEAANHLSPQKKNIFNLKTIDGLSNQQIAEKLKISLNTVKFQYSQILKELRGKLLSLLFSI